MKRTVCRNSGTTSGRSTALHIRPVILSHHRPDYKKLNVLRQLFPHVPIMALSATCPPKVLQDLVTTLRLPPVVDGTCMYLFIE
jgi:hypothetical protein